MKVAKIFHTTEHINENDELEYTMHKTLVQTKLQHQTKL
jgi:hypothetical protein